MRCCSSTAPYWLLYKQTKKATSAGSSVFFLITLEIRSKNKTKTMKSAAHSILVNHIQSLIYTYIYIVEQFLPLLQPLIVTQKETQEEERESRNPSSGRKTTGCLFSYTFTSERGISTHYKNRVIVEAVRVN